MFLLYILFFLLLESNFSSNNVEGLGTEEIVGGTITRTDHFHFVVAVMYRPPGSQGNSDVNICTGSIIGDLFIATVAHCFYDKENQVWRKSLFYIAVGIHNLRKPSSETRYVQIDRITVPSMYNPNNSDAYSTEGNLAIAKLRRNLGLRPNHPNLAKLTVIQYVNDYRGLYFAAAYGFHEVHHVKEYNDDGWEYKQFGSTDSRLRHIKVKLVSDYDCFFILSDSIAPGNMCASALSKDPDSKTGLCRFDSGAPLFHNIFLSGIAINGFRPCDERYLPGIYINVNHYRKFIHDVLAERNSTDMHILKLVETPYGYQFQEVQLAIQT